MLVTNNNKNELSKKDYTDGVTKKVTSKPSYNTTVFKDYNLAPSLYLRGEYG
jgi:hypothetical protein